MLVDDHRMFRLGLRSVIDGCDNMEVVGEASNGVEAIEAVRVTRPDVVVMDINMPKMNGIQATQEIKKRFPRRPSSATRCRLNRRSFGTCKRRVYRHL